MPTQRAPTTRWHFCVSQHVAPLLYSKDSQAQITPFLLKQEIVCKHAASPDNLSHLCTCCPHRQAPNLKSQQAAALRPRVIRRGCPAGSRQHTGRLRCTAVAAEQKTEAPGLNLLKWLRENGAAQDKVELRTLEVPAAGRCRHRFIQGNTCCPCSGRLCGNPGFVRTAAPGVLCAGCNQSVSKHTSADRVVLSNKQPVPKLVRPTPDDCRLHLSSRMPSTQPRCGFWSSAVSCLAYVHVCLLPAVLPGRPLDVTVAAADLKAGDVALSVPENLVVTLDRIFESEGLAEMLTAGKLSELACLTLYMMYEKKVRNQRRQQCCLCCVMYGSASLGPRCFLAEAGLQRTPRTGPLGMEYHKHLTL